MITEIRKVETSFALEINHISKFFPGVVALNQISMNIEGVPFMELPGKMVQVNLPY